MAHYKSGCLPSPPDNRDYTIADCMDIACDTYVRLPNEINDIWTPPIRNQGNISSCTAYAMSTVLRCIYHKIFGSDVEMSVGGLYGNRLVDEYQGKGQHMRAVAMCAKKYGDFRASDFEDLSEVSDIIKSFENAYVKNGDKMIKLVKSVVRIKDIYEAKAFLYKYKVPLFVSTKMYHIVPLGSKGLHAMACCGYDGGFICQNSWGEEDYPSPRLEFREFDEVWGVVPMENETFTDVKSDRWSAQAITEAQNDGIIDGFPDGTFKPDEPMTREQMAVIWHRIKKAIIDMQKEG